MDSGNFREGVVTYFFLATEWGAGNGGINIINYHAALALAEHVDCNVVAITPGKSWDDSAGRVICRALEKTEAPGKFDENDHLKIVQETKFLWSKSAASFWIGHDVLTGVLARKCAKSTDLRSATVVFHHHAYETYGLLKKKTAVAVEAYRNRQQHALRQADLILAVGPYLAKSARDLAAQAGLSTEVVVMIPGIFDSPAPQATPGFFRILMIGRLSGEDAAIKQTELAIAACARVARAVPKAQELKLEIVGCDDASAEAAALQEKYRGDFFQPHLLPFDTDRNRLLEKIATSSLLLMPSAREGFGLAGWEAISLGTPVIFSQASGLHQYLGEFGDELLKLTTAVELTGGDEAPAAKDIEALAAAILQVHAGLAEKKKTALLLRQQLLVEKDISWSAFARQFEAKCAEALKRKYDLVEEVEAVSSLLIPLGRDDFGPTLERYFNTLENQNPDLRAQLEGLYVILDELAGNAFKWAGTTKCALRIKPDRLELVHNGTPYDVEQNFLRDDRYYSVKNKHGGSKTFRDTLAALPEIQFARVMAEGLETMTFRIARGRIKRVIENACTLSDAVGMEEVALTDNLKQSRCGCYYLDLHRSRRTRVMSRGFGKIEDVLGTLPAGSKLVLIGARGTGFAKHMAQDPRIIVR